MKKVGLLLFLLVVYMSSFAQNRGAAEEKLIAMENAWNTAQLKHDAKALEMMIGDSFVNTEWDGSVQNRAAFLQSIRDTSMKISTLTNEDVSVFMYGDAAVVIGAYHLKGTNKGKPYEARGRFTDTWIQSNNIWKCVASSSQHLKGE